MARVLRVLSCVLIFSFQANSQIIRSPLSFLNSPYTETIIDAPRNYIDTPRAYTDARNYIDLPIEASRNYGNIPRIIEASRNYLQPQPIIAEPPCNGIAPVTNTLPNTAPSTTIITDCSPSVCKNLADTINLMVVSNLLQHSKGGYQAALQVAAPFLKDIMSNPNLVPNLVNPNLIAPNVYVPNAVSSNILPQNLITPNFSGSSVFSPAPVAPRLVAPASNPVSPNAPINNGALLSSLLKILSGPV